MKFKFTKQGHYTENNQYNPIRWRLLFRENDGSFTDQADWMKCKDFFNDVVCALRGVYFPMYGFINNDVKKNDEGVYILVKHIKESAQFIRNIDIVNERLQKDLECGIAASSVPGVEDQVLLLLPPKLWETTYYISLVTFMVRLCNYGITYKDWEDFFRSEHPACQLERGLNAACLSKAKTAGFVIPEKFRNFWWFAGPQYNSEKGCPEHQEYLIHNNGFANWNHFFQFGK